MPKNWYQTGLKYPLDSTLWLFRFYTEGVFLLTFFTMVKKYRSCKSNWNVKKASSWICEDIFKILLRQIVNKD